MKKSSSRFRRSNSVKNLLTFNYYYLSVFFFCSCVGALRAPVASDVRGENSVGGVGLMSVGQPIGETWLPVAVSSGLNQNRAAIRVSARSCVEGKLSLSALVNVLGETHELILAEDTGFLVSISAGNSEAKLTGIPIQSFVRDEVCAALKDFDGMNLKLSEKSFAELISYAKQTSSKLIPDCKTIDLNEDRLNCTLESMSPDIAISNLESFQKTMTRSWSRQPYILARRTGVLQSLAHAIHSSNQITREKFCKVLQFSLAEELPITISSKTWQKAFCEGSELFSKQAGMYGLSKGIKELSTLKELYEHTSQVGRLAVNIPLAVIPNTENESNRHPLRITITPDLQVRKNLVEEAKRNLGRSDRENAVPSLISLKRVAKGRLKTFRNQVTNSPNANAQLQPTVEMCWHPLFADNLQLLRVADGMKLTGSGYDLECGLTEEAAPIFAAASDNLAKYLLQSLSSETEFVIDNGQSKTLRLPEGQYSYTLQALPANPLDLEGLDEGDVPKTTGEFGWSRNSRKTIVVW